jgi:hypothetical protein
MTKSDFEDATKQVVKLVLGGCGLSVPENFEV